ncbi:MBL fold metallo-hydrolase [Gaopeijia maritima]|uniref:MBL fold metallo-hydrolase n=1 Tax=Gaopeijia maritima TaxID=3119007 RepID=A0ABU9E8V1_9BACT
MLHRSPLLALGLLLAAACSGGDADAPDGEGPAADAPVADAAADQQVRTADPYARGYTDDDFPRVQELAPGVYSYEQLRSAGEERFTTVSLFVVTDEGVLVADGQGSLDETERMIEAIAGITDQPITDVVVASDHGDHTAGNAAFPETARVYAHPTSAEALRAMAGVAGADAPVRPATHLVEEREALTLGGRQIEILFLGRAHTGGDLVVHLPEEKILFMSEAYLHRIFPAMRTAHPSEWVEMIERAQSMDIDIYVPGHGFVDSPAILAEELEVFQDAIRQVNAEARRLHEAGVPLEEAQEQATFGDLESWSLRDSQGARAIQQVYAELNGELAGASR